LIPALAVAQQNDGGRAAFRAIYQEMVEIELLADDQGLARRSCVLPRHG